MTVINTALCSFGMSGKVFHAPFIHLHKGLNLYAVWERSTKSAAAVYPAIKSFDSLDEMLLDDSIDLVVVNTPNYTHFEFAKKALLANKHVLVEKSFTVNVSEAEELIQLANDRNRQLSVYQNRRYDSDFKTVQKIFADGQLGKIVEAEFHFDRYNLNLSPKKHKEAINPGSGLLHDLGPHLIDQALVLFGMPLSVFGFLKVQRPLSLVNDYFDIQMFYPSLSVRLKASLVVKEQPVAYSLHGTEGSFVKVRADIQEDELKKGSSPSAENWGKEPFTTQGILNIIKDGEQIRITVATEQGNYAEFYNSLYDALTKGTALPVSAEEGLKVMRIIEAVLASQQQKKVIVL